jgi:hypothetical protein
MCKNNVVRAFEKYIIISFSNMNGTSLCVKFMYTKALLYARLFYAFSHHTCFQFTPLLNLRPLISDLTSYGWSNADERVVYS